MEKDDSAFSPQLLLSPSSPSFLLLALPQLVRLKGSSDTHALSIPGPGDRRRHIARLLLAFRRGTKSH